MREAALWPNVLWARIPRGRLRNMIATVAVVTVTVAGAALIPNDTAPTPPPSPSGVDVWVATNGNDATCTRGNQGLPCLTLNRAYQIAQQGDEVEIAAGTYSAVQTISRDATKSSSTDVIFRPAQGAVVDFSNQVLIQGSHITIDGEDGANGVMLINSIEVETATSSTPVTTDVSVMNIDATGAQSQIQTAQDVLFYNVEMGNKFGTSDGLKIQPQFNDGTTADEPTNITLDGVVIHDVRRANSTDDSHVDCLQSGGGINVTIRNSVFYHCSTQGVFLKEFNGVLDGWVIENNWFGYCTSPDDPTGVNCSNSMIVDDGVANVTVRYNSFVIDAPPFRSSGVGMSNIQVYGNAGEGPGCEGGSAVTYSYNVWDDTTCAATDVQANPDFVSNSFTSSFDLHLSSPSSPACDRGHPTNSTSNSLDYDGEARTQDGAREAGSDEKAGC